LQRAEPDHYATLGLDHRCSTEQIRAAYRLLAKRHHPDLNPGCADSAARTRAPERPGRACAPSMCAMPAVANAVAMRANMRIPIAA
jgi:hypothetical protein